MYRSIAFKQMKRVFFKTSKSAATQSGAIEFGDHFKNGASLSRMSRENFLIIVCFALLTMSLFSANAQQKGDMALGAHLAIGTQIDPSYFGIGAKFRYNITNPIRLEGSFTYFFPHKDEYYNGYIRGNVKTTYSMWDFSVSGHYLFSISDRVVLYPLAGLTILGEGTTVSAQSNNVSILGAEKSDSSTDLLINIGGGIDFKLNDQIILNAEPKIVWLGHGYIGISIGAVYKF